MTSLRAVPEMRASVVANGKHVRNVGTHVYGQLAIWETNDGLFYGLPLGPGAWKNYDLIGPAGTAVEIEKFWEAR